MRQKLSKQRDLTKLLRKYKWCSFCTIVQGAQSRPLYFDMTTMAVKRGH